MLDTFVGDSGHSESYARHAPANNWSIRARIRTIEKARIDQQIAADQQIKFELKENQPAHL